MAHIRGNANRAKQASATFLQNAMSASDVQINTRPTPIGPGHKHRARSMNKNKKYFKRDQLKKPSKSVLQDRFQKGTAIFRCNQCGFGAFTGPGITVHKKTTCSNNNQQLEKTRLKGGNILFKSTFSMAGQRQLEVDQQAAVVEEEDDDEDNAGGVQEEDDGDSDEPDGTHQQECVIRATQELVKTYKSAYESRNHKNPVRPPDWAKGHWKMIPPLAILDPSAPLHLQRQIPWIGIWCPEFLFAQAPDAFRFQHNTLNCCFAGCSGKLTGSGWVFATVLTFGGLAGIATHKYRCNTCGKSIRGWNQKLLASLPLHVQKLFDIVHFQKFAVSRAVLTFVRNAGVNRMSFTAIAAALNEVRCTERMLDTLMYYSAELLRREHNKNVPSILPPPTQIPPLSSVMTVRVTGRQLTNALVQTYGKDMLRNGIGSQSNLGLETASCDESFKIGKKTKGLYGHKMINGTSAIRDNQTGQVAIILNEDGSSAMEFFKNMYDRADIVKPNPQHERLLYVDNCCTFSSSQIPQLNRDVYKMPRYILSKQTQTVRVTIVNDANLLLFNLMRIPGEVVGFDAEWSSVNGVGPVATVQLAPKIHRLQPGNKKVVYVLEVMNMAKTNNGKLPHNLVALVRQSTLLKVGVGVQGDCTRLLNDYQLSTNRSSFGGIVDLRKLAQDNTALQGNTLNLATLARLVLGKILPKPDHLRRSNRWSNPIIPDELIEYAATDAGVSIDIYNKLVSKTPLHIMPQSRKKQKSSVSSSSNSATSSSNSATSSSSSSSTKSQLQFNSATSSSSSSSVKSIFPPNGSYNIPLDESGLDGSSSSSSIPPPPSLPLSQPSYVLKEASERASNVLLDTFHLLDRYAQVLSTAHPLFKSIMARLGEALFIANEEQMAELIELYELWGSKKKENKVAFATMKKKVLRVIAPKEKLAARVHFVIAFFQTNDTLNGNIDPLITKKVMEVHKKQMIHITKGCVSDPEGRPMYRIVSDKFVKRFMCYRGTNGLEGFHFHLRAFLAALRINPKLLNVLLHEFMHRFNTKCRIRNCGEMDWGMFSHEILEQFSALIEGNVGEGKAIAVSPLGEWEPQDVSMEMHFCLTSLIDHMEDVQGGQSLRVVADPELGELEIEDPEIDRSASLLAKLTSLEFDAPKPMTTNYEVALLSRLYAEMARPATAGGRVNPIDWILLTQQFNQAVSEFKKNAATKDQYTFKTVELLKSGFKLASESEEAKKQINDKDGFFKMIKMLRRSGDVNFPLPQPAVVSRKRRAVSQLNTSSSSSSSSLSVSQSPASKFDFAVNELHDRRDCPLCNEKCAALVGGKWVACGSHEDSGIKKHGGRAPYPKCLHVDYNRHPNSEEVRQASQLKVQAKRKLERQLAKATKSNKKKKKKKGNK